MKEAKLLNFDRTYSSRTLLGAGHYRPLPELRRNNKHISAIFGAVVLSKELLPAYFRWYCRILFSKRHELKNILKGLQAFSRSVKYVGRETGPCYQNSVYLTDAILQDANFLPHVGRLISASASALFLESAHGATAFHPCRTKVQPSYEKAVADKNGGYTVLDSFFGVSANETFRVCFQ